MTPEVAEHIWEPFFTTKGEQGTGLGLDVAKSIVEGHGGTITCQTAPQEAAPCSRFTCRFSKLPIAPAEAAVPPAGEAVAARLHSAGGHSSGPCRRSAIGQPRDSETFDHENSARQPPRILRRRQYGDRGSGARDRPVRDAALRVSRDRAQSPRRPAIQGQRRRVRRSRARGAAAAAT